MPKKSTQASFIEKALLKFGDGYDYSLVQYVNAKTKVTILCKQHGAFEQTPDKHLQSTYPCPECLSSHKKESAKGKQPTVKREPISPETYLLRFKEKHGDAFTLDFSLYESFTQGKVILHCPTHGSAEYNPQALMISKYACRACSVSKKAASKTKSYDEFVADALSTHSSFYSYPKENEASYVNRKSVVAIECPIHGTFEKTAQKHLSGQGCIDCMWDRLRTTGKLPGGYSDIFFEQHPELKDEPAFLYYLKIGHLYKIGITRHLQNRIKSIRSESKNEVSIVDVLSTTLFQAYQLEQRLLSEHDEQRVYSKWSTELFKRNVLEGISLDSIQ